MICIRLLTISQRQPGWVDEGFHEYQRRLAGSVHLQLVTLPLPKRKANASLETVKQRESEQMRNSFSGRAVQVALDASGRQFSTEQLARQMNDWLQQGQDVDLLVGGPEGLADSIRDEARMVWSLSPLTFPHGLVRVIVAEQIYRAWTVLQGHPYHRA